jgi:hypothetical protein
MYYAHNILQHITQQCPYADAITIRNWRIA